METSSLLGHDYTEIYSRVPYRLQFAYGVGHVLNDVCASMWFTYLLVFFHYVLEFTNWQAGFVLLVGQIADGLATPFVGYQSDQTDNSWLCRYGRRKTWHLIGTICVLISFPFIFAPCPNGGTASKSSLLFYYCMFVIIFQFGWAAVQISHLSLIPEITPNDNDRTKLTAIRYAFTVISNVLVYVITWFALHIDDDGNASQINPKDAWKFQEVVWTGLGIGVVASIIFHVGVKEGNSGNDVRGGQARVSVGSLLCSLQVYQVAIVYMSTRLFVNLSQIFIPLYLHETLQMAASALALIPLVMFIGSFLTSFAIEGINRVFGRRLSYIIGCALGLAACTWIQLRSGHDFITYDIYAVAVLFGVGGSIILVTSLGITADLIGDNTGSGAFVYGIMSFCDKFANGIAVIIIQDLHSTKDNRGYYRDVITYACGGAALLGAIAVISLMNKIRDQREGYDSIPGDSSINTDLGNDTSSQVALIT